MFDQATIVASVPSRWLLNPSYMHTFGITKNYFIIVEQPLSISFVKMTMAHIKQEPMINSFKYDNESVRFKNAKILRINSSIELRINNYELNQMNQQIYRPVLRHSFMWSRERQVKRWGRLSPKHFSIFTSSINSKLARGSTSCSTYVAIETRRCWSTCTSIRWR